MRSTRDLSLAGCFSLFSSVDNCMRANVSSDQEFAFAPPLSDLAFGFSSQMTIKTLMRESVKVCFDDVRTFAGRDFFTNMIFTIFRRGDCLHTQSTYSEV